MKTKKINLANNSGGFSLIELLIVVVIIGIIAAIAIPNLLAARRAANEASAIGSLRVLHGAQMIYQATSGGGSYAQFLSQLRDANLIDSVLGNATVFTAGKSGYWFQCGAVSATNGGTNGSPASFACYATVAKRDGVTASGTRDFGITTSGVLVYSSSPIILDQTSNQGMQLQTANGSPLLPLNY